MSPEKARQFVELINDPQFKVWLDRRATAPERQEVWSDAIDDWETAVHDRLAALVAAFPSVPSETANAAGVIMREVNQGRPGLVVGVLLALAILGSAIEWLVRQGLRAGPQASAWELKASLEDAVAIPTFALVSIGAFVVLEWPPLLRRVVLTILVAFIAVRAVRATTRFLLKVGSPDNAPAHGDALVAHNEMASFWNRQITAITVIGLTGCAVVDIMPHLGFSSDVARLTALLFGQVLLWVAVVTVWRRPGASGSVATKSILSLYLIVLWLAWAAGLNTLLWVGIFALTLPPVIRTAGDLARALANRWSGEGLIGVVVDVVAVRGARAAIIGIAALWLAYIWRNRTVALFSDQTSTAIVFGLLNGIVILLIADLLWQLSKAFINYRMQAVNAATEQRSDETTRNARMRTLLPIFRNVLAVFICVIAVLTVLAGMGVQILPLIAGAGVVGVAIGFGSQTLVKDILSGVFYLLDDAFRVGEYIQTGSYKGTVESFSLRSVRLRHHRGPVYTVPFGQLGAIQNMSRDWAIEKMTIGVTHDADIELARKLVKSIGQELASDPEFAADILEPLKMQGIDSFGDFAIVLKIKMKTKPGTQFALKRRAFMMIKRAFEQNGIKIAVPTVHVDGTSTDSPAAAQQIIKMHQAARLVVSEGGEKPV